MDPINNFMKSHVDQLAYASSPIEMLISDNLVEILKKLPFESLASTALVSKSWQNLSDNDGVWKEIIKAELPFGFKIDCNMSCKQQFRVALEKQIKLILENEKQIVISSGRIDCLFPEPLLECLKSNVSNKLKSRKIKEFIKRLGFQITHLCKMAYCDENFKCLKILLALGADPNIRSSHGHFSTPIFCAMHSGKLEAIKAVIDAGGDLNVKNRRGETVWDVAQMFFSQEDIQELKDYAENKLREKNRGAL